MSRLTDYLKRPKILSGSDVEWTPKNKPAVVLDGHLHLFRDLPAQMKGEHGYIVGASDGTLARALKNLDIEHLRFYEMRVADLSPLTTLPRLRHLVIEWNTKLLDLRVLRQLPHLETLVLIDTPKTSDLSPIADLKELTALEYSGGMWNRNTATTLEPLTALPRLTDLRLFNVKVVEGGLKPLARCRTLEWLEIDNHFSLEDYAYLSVALPHVKGDHLVPWVPINAEGHGESWDRLLMGRPTRVLNSKLDTDQIAARERKFAALQEKFRKLPLP